MKKHIIAFALIMWIFICMANCNQNAKITTGKGIYKKYCVNCHGTDGRLGSNGALDLSRSQLPLEGRVEIIKHGRVTMMGFERVLSDSQIDSVARYTLELKQ